MVSSAAERLVELGEALLRRAVGAVQGEEGAGEHGRVGGDELEVAERRQVGGEGSASASRMSATMRSVVPAASSVTSISNSEARTTQTRAGGDYSPSG